MRRDRDREKRSLRARIGDRLALARLRWLRPAPGFVAVPEPRIFGFPARGRALMAGSFRLAGEVVEAPGRSPWELVPPSDDFAAGLHAFDWAEDLAAVASPSAEARLRAWTAAWAARFGRGGGPGWTPALVARRTLAWIALAAIILPGLEAAEREQLLGALRRQVRFLARRWPGLSGGLERARALAACLHGALVLAGEERLVRPTARALSRLAQEIAADEGAAAARNPEAFLELFALMAWARVQLRDAGRVVPEGIELALRRMAPGLRALRHADGGLARFQGGGRGRPGLADRALADAGRPPGIRADPVMGHVRLRGGRTTVLMDAAPPPTGPGSELATASTLAIEVTSGRRPLIVSCGPGAAFGPRWQGLARGTAAFSTLAIDGEPSARLADPSERPGTGPVVDGPGEVMVRLSRGASGGSLMASHDGWVRRMGLSHIRRLELSPDGRTLIGEDVLAALEAEDRVTFHDWMEEHALEGVSFAIHFHLHPQVEAELDPAEGVALLTLPSGEVWILRHDAGTALSIEPSVHLSAELGEPAATRQVVLTARMIDYAITVSWSLAKAAETPVAVRDLAWAEAEALATGPFPGE